MPAPCLSTGSGWGCSAAVAPQQTDARLDAAASAASAAARSWGRGRRLLLQSGRGCVAGGGVYGRRTAAQGHLGPRPYGNRHEVRAHMKRWTHRPNRRTHRPGHTKDAQTQAQAQPGLRHTEDTGSDRDLGTGLRETHSGRRGPPTHAVTAVDSLAQTSLGWPPRPEQHPPARLHDWQSLMGWPGSGVWPRQSSELRALGKQAGGC